MSLENPEDILNSLTERERDVLEGMAAGLTNKDIAAQYSISVATVRWYTKQLYMKLGVNNRTQASIYARELGIFNMPSLQADIADTTASPPHNMPRYASKFIGRNNELEAISKHLQDDNVRLLSILGTGGMGKTRLAVEIGQHLLQNFPDGVCFISLGATTTTDEAFLTAMWQAVASLNDGFAEVDTFAALHDKRMLLIFDNFEQSRAQTPLIVDLLAKTTHPKILITSQVSLNLQQEYVYRLGGLLNPEQDDPETLADAVALFTERVQHVQLGFSLERQQSCVQEICRLVAGMPLAIELAAAWLKTVSCSDVLTELRDNLDLLATTAADRQARHQNLQALFAHTWQLLSEDEQRIFKRLGVFHGEFGLAAAKQVAGASLSTLAALVDWSLVQRTRDGLYQLHELARHFAEQQLKANQRSVQSNVAFALISLMNGDFSEIETLANQFLEDSSDEMNLDKGFAMAVLAMIAGAEEDYEHCLQLGEASLVLTAESTMSMLFTYLSLSIGYCGTGVYSAAETALHQALDCALTLQAVAFINLCLCVGAVVYTYQDRHKDALTIISLLSHHPSQLPRWLQSWTAYANLYSMLEAYMPDDEFVALWDYGKTLEVRVAAQRILSDTPLVS